MSSIRCDNAECVVYVEELAREWPHRFVLEISTRSLAAGRGYAELAVQDHGVDHEPTEVRRPLLAKARLEARRQCSRPAERPCHADERPTVAHAFLVHAVRARLAATTLGRVVKCRLARRVCALLDADHRVLVGRSSRA